MSLSKLKLTVVDAQSNPERTNFTWKNINIKTIVGEINYKKYEIFKISLYSIASSTTVNDYGIGNGAIEDDKLVNIIISGLPIINGTYSQSNRMNNNVCYLTTYQFPPVGDNAHPKLQMYDAENNSVCFMKTDNCDFNIYYTKVNNDQQITSNNYYPYMTFLFNIEGVE